MSTLVTVTGMPGVAQGRRASGSLPGTTEGPCEALGDSDSLDETELPALGGWLRKQAVSEGLRAQSPEVSPLCEAHVF